MPALSPSTRSILACALILAAAKVDRAQAHELGDSRVLQFFDFDERRLGNPEEIPMHWEKREGTGLPHYVRGKMVGDVGRSSGHSFRLDLNGGSVAYRTEANLIAVVPNSRYRIEAFAKTTPLENARARLSAYLVDAAGELIPGTLRNSEPYQGTGLSADWKNLTVELHAAEKYGKQKPAFLVVELGLLQPVLYAPSALGERTLFKEDVAGSAWFTDVSVNQVPEVAVITNTPGNVFPRGAPIRLLLTISDREASDLSMRLEVRDADGAMVHQRSGPLEMEANSDHHRMVVTVPALAAGWYEAHVVLTSSRDGGRGGRAGGEVVRERQAFIQLADDGQNVTPDPRFGVIATRLAPAQWSALPTLLPMLGAGRVKIAVWAENADIQGADMNAFERLLERLQDASIVPTGVIAALPPDLAASVGSSSVARLARLEEAAWKPRLSYLIAQHANHLDRWQLGLDGQEEFARDPNHRKAYDAVFAAFEGLVHDPDVAIPWPATFEADRKLPSTVAVSLPADVTPEQVPLYVQEAKDRGGRRLSLTMSPLDLKYGRLARLEDFGQRYVTALAAGADRLDLPLPFSADGQPEELLLAMRTLNQTLAGAAYRGRVNLADGVVAHLFERRGTGVLAMWSRVQSDKPVDVRLNLGGRPSLIDLCGNSSPLRQAADATEPGQVRVPVTGAVTFVDGIDAAVALFRLSVALDNPILESSFKPHTRKLTFTNTFPEFISGSFKVTAPEGWTVMPTTFNFALNPGDAFSREVTIEIPYNSLAGTRQLGAEFDIPNIKPAHFRVPMDVKLGLNEVGLQTVATREGSDVVVQLLIANQGQKNINYTAFALFPGLARQERLVTDLGPGRSVVKRFRFPAAQSPDPRKIRVGLREIEGTKVLNDEVLAP